MKLKMRNAIITGANQGLGKAIAEGFIQEGASIVICARNSLKLQETAEKLKTLAGPKQKIISLHADVSISDDVKYLIDISLRELERIDILVNNAGVIGPKGPVEDINIKEWVKAIEINLFGIFFTCKYIIPHMKKNHYGKIINLSGGGATLPVPRISAYGASKAGVVRLTETLAEECREFNIDINAVAPGALNTNILDEILATDPELIGKAVYEKALKQKETGGMPMERAVSLCKYLASSESDGITGKLISAIWDPWEKLIDYNEHLQKTDIYTLRRIVPEDRGKKFI